MVSGRRWRLGGGCFHGGNAVGYLNEDGIR
jgi:hypothetical protein